MEAKQEIAHLFAHLGSSGCEFNRNGTWYPSARAVSHLNRKYEYLLKKGWVRDTEAFIERAATQSSFTGKPYLVRCAGDPPIASAAWLRAELTRYRAAGQRAAQSASDSRQAAQKPASGQATRKPASDARK